MSTKSITNELLLVAIFGICSWGCTLSSGNSGGNGGATSAGGTVGGATSTGGTAGSSSSNGGAVGGATGNGGAGGDTVGAGGGTSAGGQTGSGGSTVTFDPTKLPCDIYQDDGGPCVAAHSTVRLLRSAYNGPLYQIKKTDGTTQDIGVLSNGFAKSADQDSFCGTDACTISIIYDQSGQGNDLTKAPPGGNKTTPGNEAKAKALPATIGGNPVYGVHVVAGVGYRNNSAKGTATGDNPQTMYMIAGGSYYNGGCCFDYGNAETNSRDNGEGTMEAVYFGTCTIWGKGADNGPWVMGDLENGLWAGNISPYNDNKSLLSYTYVTGMVKGDVTASGTQGHWAIKEGNAQSGPLSKPFDGVRPNSRYIPMRKEGAIILGTGGDNSNSDQGNFFEGIMTARYSSDAADDAVQANIVSVYGQ